MSSLELCDGDDCYQSENDVKIFNTGSAEPFLKQYCKSWFKFFSTSDLCQDCVDNINADYEGFLEIGEHDGLKIGEKYLNDPALLD